MHETQSRASTLGSCKQEKVATSLLLLPYLLSLPQKPTILANKPKINTQAVFHASFLMQRLHIPFAIIIDFAVKILGSSSSKGSNGHAASINTYLGSYEKISDMKNSKYISSIKYQVLFQADLDSRRKNQMCPKFLLHTNLLKATRMHILSGASRIQSISLVSVTQRRQEHALMQACCLMIFGFLNQS
jgi:hypothetical protein